MKIFCIGDIVSSQGRDMVRGYLDELIYQKQIDFVIANGENAAHGNGLTKKVYEELCELGIDGLTMGNHTWGCKDITDILSTEKNVIRPANFDRDCPGRGTMLLSKKGKTIGVINLIGQTFMGNAYDSAFRAAEDAVKQFDTSVILVDFHAEATSEKIAMGWYLDGKVSAVFGTHTHVQTADESILPKGTGYITDLGMTGSANSVLGRDKGGVINKFLTAMPQKFELAVGMNCLSGCIFDIDEQSGKTIGVERILIKE